jgi:hypothetical protein
MAHIETLLSTGGETVMAATARVEDTDSSGYVCHAVSAVGKLILTTAYSEL